MINWGGGSISSKKKAEAIPDKNEHGQICPFFNKTVAKEERGKGTSSSGSALELADHHFQWAKGEEKVGERREGWRLVLLLVKLQRVSGNGGVAVRNRESMEWVCEYVCVNV